MKHTFFKHPAIHSATKLFWAAFSAAALFGTSIPTAPAMNDNGRIPVIAGPDIPWQYGTEDTGDGQGISLQNDEEVLDRLST